MNASYLYIAFSALWLVSCEKSGERLLVEEKRASTTKDLTPKMFATSDQRFRDVKPSPVEGTPPQHWLALPQNQFRLLNYRFGESGLGEAYVSLSAGTVMENTNRWLKQFGRDALDEQGFAKLEKISIVGTQGVWVEAEGEYGAGMGAEAKPGYALAGVIAEVNGKILTVKMVGPKNEVLAEKEALRTYIGTMRMIGN